MNKTDKLLKKFEHLRAGRIGVETGDDIWTDDWMYEKGDKQVIITYDMRHSDIKACIKLLEYLEKYEK